MEKFCPNCGKEIQSYHQFCPWCDADFPTDGQVGTRHDDIESAEKPVSEDLTCPACGKSIQAYHEFCPWCNVDFPVNDEQLQTDGSQSQEESPPAGSEASFCRYCGNRVPAEFKFCPSCRTEMSSPEITQSPGHQSDTQGTNLPSSDNIQTTGTFCSNCGNPIIAGYNVCNSCGIAIPAMQTPSFNNNAGVIPPSNDQLMQHPGTVLQTLSPSTEWNPYGPVPLTIYFNTGKIYRKSLVDVLEFHIANNSDRPLNNLKFIVEGKLIRQSLTEELSFMLSPGIPHALHVTGFIPSHAGKDALKITVAGSAPDLGEFHLISETVLITIVDDEIKKKPDQNINVNISSEGPLIVDMEDALAKFEPDKPEDIGIQGYEQWQPVSFFWDTGKMERESRHFPTACIRPEACSLDEKCLIGLQSVSPENAPKAVLSCETGAVYNLIAGSCLFLGRNVEMNHVQSILFPADRYQNENLKVSKQHCQIFIREHRVYVRDTSQNCTYLGNQRITKNQEVLLPHDEIISIADILKIQSKIFTDGNRILCVLLKRIHNKTQEHHIMVNSFVPIGSDPNLPIILPGASDFCGAFYFHPQSHSWRFKQPFTSTDATQDTVFEEFQEMVFGDHRYWFSKV